MNHVQQLYTCHLPPKKQELGLLVLFVCFFLLFFVLFFFFCFFWVRIRFFKLVKMEHYVTMCPFGLGWKWRFQFWAESGVFSSVFSCFFFSLLHVSKITWFYCAGDKKYCSCIVHALFMYCSRTVHVLFTNPTILFIHLKIILLQCFQFSIFSFSNNKFNPNGLYVKFCLINKNY